MQYASSARSTWRAPASASEYTATVFTPRRCAVWITRQAISPRLATSVFLNMRWFPRRRPGRLTLLQERADAFLAVGGGARGSDARGGAGDHVLVDGAARHAAYQFLACRDCRRAGSKQVAEQGVDTGVEFRHGDDVVDQADAQRFGGAKAFGGKEVAPRMALAHGGDHIGADGGCGQPELDFGEAELGL